MARRKRKIRALDSVLDWSSEDAEFRRAMAGLGSVPDKDGSSIRTGTNARTTANRGSARGTTRGRNAGHRDGLDKLDLHGATAEQAIRRLESFVQRTRASGRRQVLVVTGKGRRSERGVPVVRNAVIRWLQRTGGNRVERFEAAPRLLGGSGALILTLRPVGCARRDTDI